MRTAYIANDGKEFDDEYDYYDYEWRLNHPNLKDVKIYNEDFEEIDIDDIFETEVCANVCYVEIPSELALKDFHELANYTGFSAYDSIDDVGMWKYIDWTSSFHKPA